MILWNAETGALIARLDGHEHWYSSIAFSPDGRRMATGSRDRTVRVWDAETGALIARLDGHELGISSVAFSPDGRRIASGSYDNMVRVWDAETGALITRLDGHTSAVQNVAFDHDGRRIVSVSRDRTERVWDAETGACLDVITGRSDGGSVAPGIKLRPFRGVSRVVETVIESSVEGAEDAWFPDALEELLLHPSAPIWAGAIHNHVILIRLEGSVSIPWSVRASGS
jgi:WD40 repeat protein